MVSITWRWSVEQTDLDGCESSENPLTDFSRTNCKSGRPPRISDEVLLQERNDLLFVFGENWALIGWELQHAQTSADLRTEFRRVQGINCSSLEAFRQEYRQETTFPQFQATRSRLQKVNGELRKMHPELEKCRRFAEVAQKAPFKTGEGREDEELHRICQETREALRMASNALSQLQNSQTRLEIKVREREASFAQSELLDFIRSDRYALSPLTFANAMAGIPAIHWRQSMARCLQVDKDQADGKPKSWPRGRVSTGLTYSQFLTVEKVLNQPAANAEQAVERMKTRLVQANGQDVATLNGLAENWYFLRCAIESVFHASQEHEGVFPYRVFAEYQKRFRCQELLESLRAEREIITTRVYLKERRRVGNPGQRKA
jgi:hypothetical protein